MAEQPLTSDEKADKKYKEQLKKIARVADSRRNMRIDMRPSVLSRTMTKELLIMSFSGLAVISK